MSPPRTNFSRHHIASEWHVSCSYARRILGYLVTNANSAAAFIVKLPISLASAACRYYTSCCCLYLHSCA